MFERIETVYSFLLFFISKITRTHNLKVAKWAPYIALGSCKKELSFPKDSYVLWN